MDSRSKAYLERYLSSLPLDVAKQYTSFSADYFCADEHNANVCADLVVQGDKQATCSLEYWYSQKGELRPAVGHLQVVTRWDGEPVCIIETMSVSESRFCDVDEAFAAAEGEGDKSLAWWREAHWRFFSDECRELDIKPAETMLLLLERFKVVYR
ncbi:ASCH domain-containing protein [Vibrio ulleungensis]|uniref:ASCH domain-containing protein n=1 Tax=Vibrio ulleungensis TaxID=2807619 RepID=A0ABS2HBT2_9VIBR|nr:ASCH domain-containing protein [Vibrio ulleungensis]MBM7035058.1 ASCH domain-containing protein [Vibrio ulleungensis]